MKDKRLLALGRELEEMRWQTMPLETPIQRGWIRCYFLTAEAHQRPDAALLEAILREINVIRYHWRHSFEPTKRKRRTRLQQLDQPLQGVRAWRWQRRDFPQACCPTLWPIRNLCTVLGKGNSSSDGLRYLS